MKLINAEPTSEHLNFLYQLLVERPESANISHQELPDFDEHVMFFKSQPYYKWLMIEVDCALVGAVYITWRNEIGISIEADCEGCGYGSDALEHLIKRFRPLPANPGVCNGRFVANINPENVRSIELFKRIGFRHLSNTYALEP